MQQKISNKLKIKINKIASFLNINQFILYGGAAVDLLTSKTPKDYDIAIKYKNKKEILNLRNHLKNNGFKIVEPWREYIVHKNKKVILVYAKNNKYFLDIAFLKNFNLIGLYDIESVYISYPEMRIVDKYNGLKNIKNKKINFIRNISSENPYVALGRLIYLSAKYDISLFHPRNTNLLMTLKKKSENYKSKSKYFNKQVIPSFYSHILKAILKSNNKLEFIKSLINLKVFDKIFPSLSIALNYIVNRQLINKLFKINDKEGLIKFLGDCLENRNKKEFLKEINKLKIRKWE